MVVAATLAITLDPALRLLLTRMKPIRLRPERLGRAVNLVLVGTIHSEERHPISRFLMRCYHPVAAWALKHRWTVLTGGALLVAITIPVYQRIGSEFMPPMDEGSLLYMPTTMPGVAISEVRRLLQAQDRVLESFPEVKSVFGKAGRAETSTDPAPLSMMETVIPLKPRAQWRAVATWYDRWPNFIKPICRRITPDRLPREELTRQMDNALRLPGVSNAWTMPVKNRIDMQSTGIRTALGLKIYGADVQQIEKIGGQVEAVLSGVAGTYRPSSKGASDIPSMFVTWPTSRAAGERFAQHLDSHVPAQPRVARPIHLAHAAGTERRDNLIGSESGSGEK